MFIKLYAEQSKGGKFNAEVATKQNANFFNQKREDIIAKTTKGNPRANGPTKENANNLPGRRGRKYKVSGNPRA